MPELAEDTARRVAENGTRLVPAEGQTGYYLAVTGQNPLEYAFLQPPDEEIPRFSGSPDGVRGAPIDSLVRNTVDHTVWINTDGDTAWRLVGDTARRLPELFSFSGLPEEDLESPPWRPIYAVEIVLIVAQVLIAPSGDDMIIELKLSGSLERTVTVPDGDLVVEDSAPFTIPAGEFLTATVTQSGGANSLTVHLVPELL